MSAVLSAPVLDCLSALGCTSLTLQTGASAEVTVPEIPEAERINIETYKYKPSLSQVRVGRIPTLSSVINSRTYLRRTS